MAKIWKIPGLFALGFSSLSAVQAADQTPTRRIIAFREATSAELRVSIAAASGGRIVRQLQLINAVVIEMPATRVHATETSLKAVPQVVRIDDDPKINWLTGAQAPSDFQLPEYRSLLQPIRRRYRAAPGLPKLEDLPAAGQQVPWGIKRVNAAGAWAKTKGKGVRIAVIDTGIDYSHPDLRANVAGGWNATNKEKPEDYMDDNGHGTHCSGTIAALDNDAGVVGIAPEASLYGVKVLDANGSGTFDDVIAGMQWAVEHRMQVASMSLGTPKGNDSLKAAVQAMAKNGVVLIVAAGNSGIPPQGSKSSVGYPAAYAGAIAIAASDASDKVAYFSSRGPEVALIAPGVDVDSLAPGGGIAQMSGTSMAAPHAAGLAALAISARGISGVEAVRAALQAAAVKLPGAPDTEQGAGLVDAAMLVR